MNLPRGLRNLWAVLAAIAKSHLRSKIGIFFSFLFPVMLLLIFGAIFGSSQATKYELYVQNFDRDPINGTPTNFSTQFIQSLEATETFEIKTLGADLNITTFIRDNPSFDDYRILVIPSGFQEQAMNKSFITRLKIMNSTLDQYLQYYGSFMNATERAQLEQNKLALNETLANAMENETELSLLLYTNDADLSAPVIQGILISILEAFNKNLIGAEEIIGLDSRPLVERSLEGTDYFIPGYIAAFIMTNGVIGVTATVSEYRRNGIVKRLAATPVGKGAWIVANLLHQTILAFCLMAVMIGLGFAVFGFSVVPDALALTFTFIGAVAFCSIGIILGGVIKDVEAAAGAGNAIAFPMMFLSGAFWPLDMMPGFMQTVAKSLPLYYYHEGLRQIMIYQNPQASLIPFLVMGLMAIICTLLAIKVTKWKELD